MVNMPELDDNARDAADVGPPPPSLQQSPPSQPTSMTAVVATAATADPQPKAKKRKETLPTVLPVYVGKHRTFHDLVQLSMACETLTRNERNNLLDTLYPSLHSSEVAICKGTISRRPVREIVRLLHYSASLNPDRTREELISQFAQLGVQRVVPTDRLMIKNPDMWYKYAPIDQCAWQRNNLPADYIQDACSTSCALNGNACRPCVQAIIRLNRGALWPELHRNNRATANTITHATIVDESPPPHSAPKRKATKSPSLKRKRKKDEDESFAAAMTTAVPAISTEQSFVRVPPIGMKNISATDSPASPMDYTSSEEDDNFDYEDDFPKNSN